MATYTRRLQIDRWAGEIEDFHAALDLAFQAARLHPLEQKKYCRIVIARPDLTTDVASPAEFRSEIDIRDLRLLTSVRANMGSYGDPLKVSVHLERKSPVITVEVEGDTLTEVEGVTSQLEARLQRGARSTFLVLSDQAGKRQPALPVLLAFTSGLGAFFLGRALAQSADEPISRAVISAEGPSSTFTGLGVALLLGSIAIGVAVLLAGIWASPDLELLQPGEKTRAKRLRKAAWALGAFLLSAVILPLILPR
jgi:hypothetical protein